MTPQSFEDIIRAAAAGGWDFFDSVDQEVKRRVDVDQARDSEDADAIARAWARFAASPDGHKALEKLFDTTLRRTVYFVNLGQDEKAMLRWGCFREGQNALAQEIARQVARGQREDLKPRD